jgi:hypothetical protein
MSSLASLFAWRIPVYVWVPIILSCAMVGVFASKLRPLHPALSTPPVQHFAVPSPSPVAVSPMDPSSSTVATGQGSRALGSPVPAPVPFPTDELDLPTPAPRVTDRPEQENNARAETIPSAPSSHGPGRARTARDHPLNRAQRSHNIAQQSAKTPSSGFKSVPIIGPVISLFQ